MRLVNRLKKRLAFTGDSFKPSTQKEKKKNTQSLQQFFAVVGTVSELGFAISVPIGVGVIVGWLLDRRFDTAPTLTVLLLFVGILAAFSALYKVVQKMSKK